MDLEDCNLCDDRLKFYPKGKCLKTKWEGCRRRINNEKEKTL